MLSSVLYFLVNYPYIFLVEKPANTLFFDSEADGHSINTGRSLRILWRGP